MVSTDRLTSLSNSIFTSVSPNVPARLSSSSFCKIIVRTCRLDVDHLPNNHVIGLCVSFSLLDVCIQKASRREILVSPAGDVVRDGSYRKP